MNSSQSDPNRCKRPRQWGRYWLRVFLTITAVLLCSELYLAWKGFPLHEANRYWEHPSYDPLLGWTNIPGRRASTESNLPAPVYETVWSDGRRATYPTEPAPQKQRILFVGCSYTYGLGVPDEETWAWKVAARFPQTTFENFAVYAYGACQAFAMAERQLNTPRHYDWVIYAAMHDHPHRDVNIMHAVGDVNSLQPFIFGRRAGLDKQGNLYFIPCVPRWFGDDLLRTINFGKRIYYSKAVSNVHNNRTSQDYETKVYIAELKRMNNIAREHGARFAVFALEKEQWAHDLHLEANDIDFPFICVGDNRCNQTDAARFHTNGEPSGHPSALVHSFWAQKIGDWLEPVLKAPSASDHTR